MVAGLLYGIKPAVTAIVVFAAWRIGSRALRNGVLWAIAAGAFVAIFALNIPFPWIVLGAGLVGLIGGRIAPDKFKTGGGHGASNKAYGPALIDEHIPAPVHARFSWPRTLVYSLVGLAIWGLMEGLLFARYGWQGPLTQMGWFFTKATQAAPLSGPFEWFSPVITISALLALWRCEVGVTPVIGASTLAGLAYSVLI